MPTSSLFPDYCYCTIVKCWAHEDIDHHSKRFYAATEWLLKYNAVLMEDCEDAHGHYYTSRYIVKFVSKDDMLAFMLQFGDLLER